MKNKRILVSLLLLGFVLAACTTQATPTPAAQIELSDGLSRTVVLDQPAQRIVSMAPSITEILYAIGAGDQLVGRDSFSDYPEEALNIQDVGGSMGNYSYEMIASLNPDLVLATEISTPEQVQALEDLGLTVYYLSNPVTLDDVYPLMETVGLLTGHEAETQDLVNSLQARVSAVTETVAKAQTIPVVYYELDATDPSKPYTAGPGTFLDQLIQLAGGKNLGSSLSSSWAQISIEEILVQDPDIIILGDFNYGITAESVKERAGWENLKAVKEDQIFGFNDDLSTLPGPRLVDGLEEFAKIIHPELYK